jgi:ribose 5-phosphate isomerase A
MRKKKDGSFFISDNGNYIFDIHQTKGFMHPEQDHASLSALSGVVDTGFFFNLPMRVLVGYKNGSILFREGCTHG